MSSRREFLKSAGAFAGARIASSAAPARKPNVLFILAGGWRAQLLDDLRLPNLATVQARFLYRSPGLFVLLARVYRVPEPFDIADNDYYAGCRSWVELETELSTEGATPVLDDAAFAALIRRLEDRLNPSALA